MEKSGLLAALFPGLGRWLYGNSGRLALIEAHLASLDQLHQGGPPSSLALFLAVLFGPDLEKAALARHLEGIPRQQALEETCAILMEEVLRTVSLSGRVIGRLRAILALQVSLTRMPPRRPASIAGRPEFAEALAYLRLTAGDKKEHQASLEWWDAFLLEAPPIQPSESSADKVPGRRRRRRRRKSPRTHEVVTETQE
jgi:poly(A) polymerase